MKTAAPAPWGIVRSLFRPETSWSCCYWKQIISSFGHNKATRTSRNWENLCILTSTLFLLSYYFKWTDVIEGHSVRPMCPFPAVKCDKEPKFKKRQELGVLFLSMCCKGSTRRSRAVHIMGFWVEPVCRAKFLTKPILCPFQDNFLGSQSIHTPREDKWGCRRISGWTWTSSQKPSKELPFCLAVAKLQQAPTRSIDPGGSS